MSDITQTGLKEILHYDPKTGIFTWNKRGRGRTLGRPVGNIRKDGYFRIGINDKSYLSHRLAMLYMTGEMPFMVDHIDMDRSNNKWSNLRPATRSQNGFNKPASCTNTSGYKGITWHKRNKNWTASVRINNKSKHLGSFENALEAYEFRCAYVALAHGEFANNRLSNPNKERS